MASVNDATPLEAALFYAAHGLPVFPVHTIMVLDGKVFCSCCDSKCENVAKHPTTPHGLLDATTDAKQITRWWAAEPDRNVAIRTGGETKLVVIDIDPRHGGGETWKEVIGSHSITTRDVLTGSGGHHLFFRTNGTEIKSGTDVLGRGVDVRATGGYVVAPPSLHESGARYQWVDEGAETADLPPWLEARLLAHHEARLTAGKIDVALVLAGVPEGERDVALFRTAAKLRWAGVPYLMAEQLVLTAASNCTPAFPASVARAKVASAYNRYTPTIVEQGGDRVETVDADHVRVTTAAAIGMVELDFQDMERGNREIHTELTIRVLQGNRDVWHQRINILAMTARNQCRLELDAIYGKEPGWTAILSRCFSKAGDAFERVDRAVRSDTLPVPDVIPFAIDGLIPADGPTFIFGAGSAGKTYIAMTMALALANGQPWLGRPLDERRVLWVDYETGSAMFAKRLARLTADTALTTGGIYYWDALGVPLRDQIPAVKQALERHGCSFLVVDHIAAAGGGRPEEAETALAIQRALAKVHVPSLLIAHITGDGMRDPRQVLRPFGTVFYYNMGRACWYLGRSHDDDGDRASVGFFNRKKSDGVEAQDFGVNIFFGADQGPVRIAAADLKQSPTLNAVRGREWELWEAMDRPFTIKEGARYLDEKPENIRMLVARHPHLFRKISGDDKGGAGKAALWERIED